MKIDSTDAFARAMTRSVALLIAAGLTNDTEDLTRWSFDAMCIADEWSFPTDLREMLADEARYQVMLARDAEKGAGRT